MKNNEKKYGEVDLSKIKILSNIRTRINETDLTGLMQDIKQHGLLHPIGVWKKDNDYILSYGHRRLESCKKLGWTKIPSVIYYKEPSEEDFISINTAENIHREDISPIEFGIICKKMKSLGLNDSEIAIRLSVPKTRVVTALRIYASVPTEYREKIKYHTPNNRKDRGIPASVANSILTSRYSLNKSDTDKLFSIAHKEELTVADIRLISQLRSAGMSLEEAIDKRKGYRTCVITLVINKKIQQNFNVPIRKYIMNLLRGEAIPIEGLLFLPKKSARPK